MNSMQWMTLLKDDSTDGRLEAIDCFLAEWYGPWAPEFGLPDRDVNQLWPRPARPLAWWYSRYGARPGIITYNHLIGPSDQWSQEPDAPALGSRRSFLAENQGVYVWAYSLDGDDPDVWLCPNEAGGEWKKEGEALSGFLLQLLLWESSGPISTSADWIDAACYDRLREELDRLPLAPWHWPAWKTEFFARDDVIAVGYPTVEGDQTFHVQITAKSPTLVDQLRRLVPIDHWDNP